MNRSKVFKSPYMGKGHVHEGHGPSKKTLVQEELESLDQEWIEDEINFFLNNKNNKEHDEV